MGQAFDRDGNVLGEAYGETKREVFDKLTSAFEDAHEIRIRSIQPHEDEPTPQVLKKRLRAAEDRIAAMEAELGEIRQHVLKDLK